MRILPDLFKLPNPNCVGCSILEKPRQVHSIMDHEEEGFPTECDLLFVSDSFKMEYGEITPFDSEEEQLIESTLEKIGHKNLIPTTCYTASVKCLAIKDKGIGTGDMEICRKHIFETIKKCKPKLIFVCGNLPMKMLTKKTGITTKRGTLAGEIDGIPVVPIFSPKQVAIEPKDNYLFTLDIQNAIDMHFIKSDVETQFDWKPASTLEALEEIKKYVSYDVAIDIETTGFDFRQCVIQTISLCFDTPSGLKTFAIPVNHKEFKDIDIPFDTWKEKLISLLDSIFAADTVKIFHSAKFDIRFLRQFGVNVQGFIGDTLLMQHLIDENLPKSLDDLVGYYFPAERSII